MSNESKNWYSSKLVWLGVIQTLIGILGILAEFLTRGDFGAPAVVLLFSGALTVVLRIWFTDQPVR